VASREFTTQFTALAGFFCTTNTWRGHAMDVFAFGKTLDYAGNKVAKMRLKAAA
jgi:hypothetical protein